MKRAIIKIYSPKQVEQIANGKKLIDICKKIPRDKLPIDVYIYETLGKLKTVEGLTCGYTNRKITSLKEYEGRGKVVGKFTLEKVDKIEFNDISHAYIHEEWDNEISDLIIGSGLGITQLYEYVKYGKDLYAWHITDLVIFDKPMELGEFRLPREKCLTFNNGCDSEEECNPYDIYDCYKCGCNKINKSPRIRSFTYVEVEE